MNSKLTLGLALILTLISSASASGTFSASYSGIIREGITGVGSASVSMMCPSGATSSTVSASDGSYTLPARTFYYPATGIPACTITVTHTNFNTATQNVIVTIHTANIDLTRATRTVSGSISGTDETITGMSSENIVPTSCSASNQAFTCSVYSGLQFTISAFTPNFEGSKSGNVSQNTNSFDIALTRTQYTAAVTTDINANVDYSYDGSTWIDCTGDGTTTHSCTNINSGINFRLRAEASGYSNVYYPSSTTWHVLTKVHNELPVTTFSMTLTAPVTVSGTLSPASAKVYSYYSDNVLHECTVTTGSYSCMIDAATPFTINATNEPAYINQSFNYATGLTSGVTNDITLVRNQYTINFNITDFTLAPLSTAVLTGGDSGFISCTLHACNVYATLPFNINATLTGYVNSTYTNTLSSQPTQNIDLSLNPTLKVELTGNPNRGTLSVTNTSPQTVTGNGPYYFTANPALNPFDINYTDITGRYLDAGISALNFNESSQTVIVLDIIGSAHTMTLNINNEETTIINDATLNAYYEDSNHPCTSSTCQVPHNTAFNITINKNGYVNQNYTSNGIITDASASVTLLRTLHLTLQDDNADAVKSGQIIINNSANTQTLKTTTLTNANNARDFYYELNAQTVNVYYLGGTDYSQEITTGNNIALTQDAQLTISLATTRNWITLINALNNTLGAISGYTVNADGQLCPSQYCTLNRSTHDITIQKTGYVTNHSTINANNNGSPLNAIMNQTLHVYVIDQNNNPATGEVIIYSGIETHRINLANGNAWIPVDPAGNNSPLTLKFNSTSYVRIDTGISAGTINKESTTHVTLNTITLRKLTIRVEDYYTGIEVINPSIIVNDIFRTYCTSSPCEFQTFTPPDTVNITAFPNGYFNETILNQSLSAGTVTIKVKPKILVYVDAKANVTAFNTKGTPSSEDDEFIVTMPTVNFTGYFMAGIPVDNGTIFRLLVNSTLENNTAILGPYTAGSETIIIGSASNPVRINSTAIITSGPSVTSLSANPTNPKNNEDITINVSVTDETTGRNRITMCNVKIDSGSWSGIIGAYTNYYASVSKNIGKLSIGSHTINVICTDEHDGQGNEKSIILNVINASSNQQAQDNDTNNEETTIDNNIVKLAILKTKYDLLQKVGLATPEIRTALNNAQTSTTSTNIETAENIMPLITLNGAGNVKTTTQSSPELIAQRIAIRESQPYTTSELASTIKPVMFNKKATHYTLNGEPKTLITLSVYSQEANPDAIIADFNPAESNAQMTINTNEGSITYFKGLTQGNNVYEYVINADVNETSEPIMFTMKELSQSEKTIKNITGFTIGIPGIIEVPAIYLGAGIAIIFLILKFLI